MLAAEVSAAAEHDERHDENGVRRIVRPGVVANKQLSFVDEGKYGHKGECDRQLHCEDHKDLAEMETGGTSRIKGRF